MRLGAASVVAHPAESRQQIDAATFGCTAKATRPTLMQEVARPSVGRRKEAQSSSSRTVPGREVNHAVANGYREWNSDTTAVGAEAEISRRIQTGVSANRQSIQR